MEQKTLIHNLNNFIIIEAMFSLDLLSQRFFPSTRTCYQLFHVTLPEDVLSLSLPFHSNEPFLGQFNIHRKIAQEAQGSHAPCAQLLLLTSHFRGRVL